MVGGERKRKERDHAKEKWVMWWAGRDGTTRDNSSRRSVAEGDAQNGIKELGGKGPGGRKRGRCGCLVRGARSEGSAYGRDAP